MIRITQSEKRLLKMLLDGPAISCKHLSEALGVSPARVSQIVAGLRARGIVQGTGYAELKPTYDLSECLVSYLPRGKHALKRLPPVANP
jgi:DNA-binding MarR family transcriptional regulator